MGHSDGGCGVAFCWCIGQPLGGAAAAGGGGEGAELVAPILRSAM